MLSSKNLLAGLKNILLLNHQYYVQKQEGISEITQVLLLAGVGTFQAYWKNVTALLQFHHLSLLCLGHFFMVVSFKQRAWILLRFSMPGCTSLEQVGPPH